MNSVTNRSDKNSNSKNSNSKNSNSKNNSNSNNSNILKDKLKIFIEKRKKLIMKQIQKEKINKDEEEINVSELNDDCDVETPCLNNNVKITNIIVNKLSGTDFDINTPDLMLRDIKALHLITQKALSTNVKHNPLDSIDDERKSFLNFCNKTSKKALFIDDNSDLPSGMRFNTDGKKDGSIGNISDPERHIINIININNNYNIENLNYSKNKNNSMKKSFNTINFNYYKKSNQNDSTPIESVKSNLSNKTNLKKMIPINKANSSIKEILKSYTKNQNPIHKEKFIKITK